MDIDGPEIDPSPSDHFIISATIPVHVDNIPLDSRISKLFYKFEQTDLFQIELQTDKLNNSICQKIEFNNQLNLFGMNLKTRSLKQHQHNLYQATLQKLERSTGLPIEHLLKLIEEREKRRNSENITL